MSDSDSTQPGEYHAEVVEVETVGDGFVSVVVEVKNGPHTGTQFLADIPTDHILQGEYMSQQEKQAAQEHLGRAGRQARRAGKNTVKAVKLGTEYAAEEVVDGAEHVVEEVKE